MGPMLKQYPNYIVELLLNSPVGRSAQVEMIAIAG